MGKCLQMLQTGYRSCLRSLTAFGRHERGVAAVEFAIILPALVTAYLGLAQITQAIIIDRKVTLLARTLADLTAQAREVSDTEMSNIFAAAAFVLQPVNPTPAQMTIVSVYIDKDKKVNMCWSAASGGAAKPSKAPSLPANLIVEDSSLIIANSSYDYDSPARLIPVTLNLEETIYMRPRVPPQVVRIEGGVTKKCDVT